MAEPEVSHAILKAAKLFTDRPSRDMCRPHLAQPWALRLGGKNIIFASDGHTMFIAHDSEGRGYRKKPAQVGEDFDGTMPDWRPIVRKLPRTRRSLTPVAVNPKYHARVMRAARILDVDMVVLSVGGASTEVVYTIGPDAFAVVMPMHDPERPHVPTWLRKVAS